MSCKGYFVNFVHDVATSDWCHNDRQRKQKKRAAAKTLVLKSRKSRKAETNTKQKKHTPHWETKTSPWLHFSPLAFLRSSKNRDQVSFSLSYKLIFLIALVQWKRAVVWRMPYCFWFSFLLLGCFIISRN